MHLEKATEVLFNVFYVFLAFFLPLVDGVHLYFCKFSAALGMRLNTLNN